MPTVNKPEWPWIKANPKPTYQAPKGNIPANFYRMAPWRKLRARVLENSPLCVHCLEKNRLTPAQMVDHIKPIRLGGEPLDETNLMPLCNHCHQVKRGKERHQG
ncbi:HNH endonuclease [Spirosoma fluviale]|uniref:Putative HNH nuclease YajD n=1 Tax=Spirosoma fluviale TaxID=1597977 RepID=A0A286F6Z3_9BACT|nr:HNH endonuclease signature motif containing protein [Spirosoma fluviale]SOD78985.1 HNH endonuclease [Spirosoma fluviale]